MIQEIRNRLGLSAPLSNIDVILDAQFAISDAIRENSQIITIAIAEEVAAMRAAAHDSVTRIGDLIDTGALAGNYKTHVEKALIDFEKALKNLEGAV